MSTNTTAEPTTPVEGHDDPDGTVDQLRAELNSTDYSTEELKEAMDYERANKDRTGANEALEEAFDDVTEGPEQPTTPTTEDPTPDEAPTVSGMDVDADEDGVVQAMRGSDGGGATAAGTPGIVLPNPGSEDAPATVTIEAPKGVGIPGNFFDEGGRHTVAYTMPVKLALENENNRVTLAESDPLHPSNRDDEE